MASSLVLLAGDISLNPGPGGNRYGPDDLPKVCSFQTVHSQQDGGRSLSTP